MIKYSRILESFDVQVYAISRNIYNCKSEFETNYLLNKSGISHYRWIEGNHRNCK